MKSFSDFIDESTQRGFPRGRRGGPDKEDELENARQSPIYNLGVVKINGWRIEPTIHSGSQALERRPDLDEKDWKQIHQNVIDKISNFSGAKDGAYIFLSKSYRQAYVAMVEFNRKKLRVVTVLPRGRSNPKPGTKRVIVENQELEIIEQINVD